jgi:hypothetical protein
MELALDPGQIESEATSTDIAEIARYLQAHLGQRLTAYLAGVRDPKMVGKWARGTQPRDAPAMRLRAAFQATKMISLAYDDQTAKAWLLGTNTRLDDEAPAWLLRYATSPEDLRFIVPTARAFAGAAT